MVKNRCCTEPDGISDDDPKSILRKLVRLIAKRTVERLRREQLGDDERQPRPFPKGPQPPRPKDLDW